MKKLFVVLVLIAVAVGVFAEDVFASYNKPGNINLYASGGYHFNWGLQASVAGEYMIGEFELGTVPLDWGVAVRGGFEFWGTSFDFSIGALATLHLGLGVFPIEFYTSLGVCYDSWSTFPVTVAGYGGVTWWFSKNMGLLVESGWLGWYFWGVGIEFKL